MVAGRRRREHHQVTQEPAPGGFFKRQGAYGAFTLRQEQVAVVRAYIEGQKERHGGDAWRGEWEHAEAVDEDSRD